ncbi:MAG: DUF308 domain-containing protein [Anaerovoracaceae bacterium]
MRILIIISGCLFFLTGVFCIANPGETFLTLAFVLGIVMVANGVIQAISYIEGRRGNKKDNNGWILADAMITFILGVFVLFNQIVADVTIPMVFGLWLLFSGTLRVVAATHINRDEKSGNFWGAFITGMLCIIGGIFAFVNQLSAGVAIAILLGVLFFLQGISILELGIHLPHEKRKGKKSKKNKNEIKED